MSGMWIREARNNADRRLPVLLRLSGLQSAASAEARGLLRLLLIRLREMPVCSGPGAPLPSRGLPARLKKGQFSVGDYVFASGRRYSRLSSAFSDRQSSFGESSSAVLGFTADLTLCASPIFPIGHPYEMEGVFSKCNCDTEYLNPVRTQLWLSGRWSLSA